MEHYKTIKPSKSLEVIVNDKSGILEFKGRSILEDSEVFYNKISQWVRDTYGDCANKPLTINMFLEYFNTQSQKAIYSFFRTLEEVHNEHKAKVNINWHFEEDDEEMMYQGEEFRQIFDVPLNIVEVEDFGCCAN